MNKILILFSLAIVAALQYVNAQNVEVPCGYIPDEDYIKEWEDLSSFRNQRLSFVKSKEIEDIYDCRQITYDTETGFDLVLPLQAEDASKNKDSGIPVIAFIIRKKSGNNGISDEDLRKSLDNANKFYEAVKIKFDLCEIKYVDNDDIYNHNFSSTSDNNDTAGASYTILDVENRNVKNKLNIYFVPKSNTSWAWRPNKNKKKQHLIMFNVQAKNKSTLAHELGHWLDLMHTHGPNDRTEELVDGSNCNSKGDRVCDTPADPKLSGLVNSRCVFDIEKAKLSNRYKDVNDSIFKPDTRNVMAYTHKPCRSRFTLGQINRMHAAYKGTKDDRGYELIPCDKQEIEPTIEPISINWNYALQLPAYSEDNPNWATCLSVLLSWRDNMSYSITDIINSVGNVLSYFPAQSPDIDKIPATGLVAEPPTSYTPQGLADMLEYGPMWISSTESFWGMATNNKSRVIVGLEGDGTILGTQVYLFDPSNNSSQGIVSMSFNGFIAEIENEWAMDIPGSFYMVHP